MSSRIVRAGTVLAVSAGGCRVGVSGPCSGCRTGCLAFRPASSLAAIDVPDRCVSGKSGRMGAPVLIGISSSGLTRLAAILFGPVVVVMVVLTGMTSMGYSGLGFAAGAVVTVCVAVLVSRNWARRVADTGLGLRVTSQTGAEQYVVQTNQDC